MDALLMTISLWLCVNFGFAATDVRPRLEFVDPEKIVERRYGSLAKSALQAADTPAPTGKREVVSVYDDKTRTIFLARGWSGGTPAELSILVHEMVHHLQNVGEVKFACPHEREQVAYRAQQRWLHMFGRDLEQDFNLDPFTLLVSTTCHY